MAEKKITLDQIESKIRDITGPSDEGQKLSFSPQIAAIAVAFFLIVVAFMIGKKKGKVKSTVVEIKRI